MATKKISSAGLIWMFHEKLREYSDHPFNGIALAIIRSGNGNWEVITQRKLPKRKPIWRLASAQSKSSFGSNTRWLLSDGIDFDLALMR